MTSLDSESDFRYIFASFLRRIDMTDATAIRAVVETPATQARHGPLRAGACRHSVAQASPPACPRSPSCSTRCATRFARGTTAIGPRRRTSAGSGGSFSSTASGIRRRWASRRSTQFLTALAVERHVSASTQNQALAAVLFLYQEVLGCDPGLARRHCARQAARAAARRADARTKCGALLAALDGVAMDHGNAALRCRVATDGVLAVAREGH